MYWTHFFFKPWPYSQILQVLCQIKATSDPNSSFFEGRGRTNLVNTDFLKAQSEGWFPGKHPARPVLGRRGNVCDHLGLVSCPHGSSSRYSGQVVMITTEINLSAQLLIWLSSQDCWSTGEGSGRAWQCAWPRPPSKNARQTCSALHRGNHTEV